MRHRCRTLRCSRSRAAPLTRSFRASLALLCSSSAQALAAGFAKFYAKYEPREKTVGQFKHTQKCIDSLVTKVFKDGFQS